MNIFKDSKKKHLAITGVILLITTHCIINYIWLKKDNFPLWFDYGAYFKRSIDMFYASQTNIAKFIETIFATGEHGWVFQPHRIVLPLFSLPWYYIFGVSPDVAVMSCTTFLAIAIFSTYGIASRIFDRTTGFLSAFILSVSPGFFTFYRRYSPEFATIAMVSLAAYLLLRSKDFNNRLYSILFGIGFAFCMLTKEMALAFILGILLYSVYKGKLLAISKLQCHENKQGLINLFLSLFIAGIIMFFVYWVNRTVLLDEIFNVAYSDRMREMYGMPNRYSLKGVLFYPVNMIRFGFLPLYSFFSILGIFFCIRYKKAKKGFLFSWLIISYVILLSTQTRAFEYAMPAIIPLAILASCGITNVFRNIALKTALIFLIMVWGGGQLWISTFPIAKLPKWVYCRSIIAPVFFREHQPINQDWKLEKIIDYLISNSKDYNKIRRVHVGANLYAFSAVTLGYVAAQKKADLEFCGYATAEEEVLSCDFIVVKNGENQGIFYTHQEANELISLVESQGDFKKMPRNFFLADGSESEVYKKIW